MLHSRRKLLALTILIFLAAQAVGYRLALKQHVWNDEIYSQLSSVEKTTVMQVLRGDIEEGNNAPLFYLLQKGLQRLAGYDSPEAWKAGTSRWKEPNRVIDLIILRIQSVMLVSAVIALFFYYFASRYSFWHGLLALGLTLTTPMFWTYWAEARHYGLWIFLTGMQLLVFMDVLRKRELSEPDYVKLAGIHFLLSMTVILSLPQVVILSLILIVLYRPGMRQVVFLAVIPCAVCFYYYGRAPSYKFSVMFKIDQYIRAGISRDRLYIMILYAVLLTSYLFQQQTGRIRWFRNDRIRQAMPLLWHAVGVCLAATALVVAFRLGETPDKKGFPVTTRYFVSLAPVGIAMTVVFVDAILASFHERRAVQAIMALTITSFFVYRVTALWPQIVELIEKMGLA